MKRVVLLGSTGSIGRNTLDVVEHHADRFEVVGLVAGHNAALMAEQGRRHGAARVALADDGAAERLREAAPDVAERLVGLGESAITELVESVRPDLVINSLVGFVGLRPTLAALGLGIDVAIANKETVVTGGALLQAVAKRTGARLIPIDSEHVAISQCLAGAELRDVDRIVVTASGGALREVALEDLADATVEAVLRHPTWSMGDKITVDCATMVNKGLEVIEARWLFDVSFDKIDVVCHPQSIVHSFVEFVDGLVLAQMGEPDMRLPILHALSYPERLRSHIRAGIDRFKTLSFEPVDRRRYPCFDLVVEAGRAGGTAPAIMNAANEEAVSAFLGRRARFGDIQTTIEGALEQVESISSGDIDDIFRADAAARRWASKRLGTTVARPERRES